MEESDSPSDAIVSRTLRALSRHDLVLAVVPVALGLAAAAGLLSSLPIHATLAAGSVVAGGAVADALFFDPPTGDSPRPGGRGGRGRGRR